VFPDLEQILANNTNAVSGGCEPFAGVWPVTLSDEQLECYSEFLPTADYVGFGANASPPSLNFRLIVRDSRHDGGGIGSAATQLILAHGAGPFLVTSQSAEGTTWRAGSTETVTWDVAGTDAAPVSAANVRISLSLDGGWTYPHVLAESTPNDGTAQVVVPNADTAEARVKIEAVGNVFFDVSDRDFRIMGPAAQLAELIDLATGKGAGRSLENIARAAAGTLALRNVAGTCGHLNAFLNDVRVQTGRTLTPAQAEELSALARNVRTALGC
jgi:trimeric autotransporter adhesin